MLQLVHSPSKHKIKTLFSEWLITPKQLFDICHDPEVLHLLLSLMGKVTGLQETTV